MAKVPGWARKARQKWKYTGKERPPFAEDPKPGQESVWDYPRPPKVEADERTIIVQLRDTLIAESLSSVRILETAGAPVFYLPSEDVKMELLERSDRVTRCEWKGYGTYRHVTSGNETLTNVAWSYDDPFPEFEDIRGMISFYPARLACYVDGERVRPQPGGFYGGWVTSEIVGPMKGEEGSELWW